MFDLDQIFSSKAKIKVLRVLYYHSEPLLLRHVARIADLPVYSIQRALKQLLDDQIIIKKKKKHYTYYTLNKNHPSYEFIVDIFKLQIEYQGRSRSKLYHDKAKRVLKFSDSSIKMLRKAKKTTSCLNVEDVIIAKLYSVNNDATRFKDLDDLQSIFLAEHELDLDYLCGQMQKLHLKVPRQIKDIAPRVLGVISKKI